MQWLTSLGNLISEQVKIDKERRQENEAGFPGLERDEETLELTGKEEREDKS